MEEIHMKKFIIATALTIAATFAQAGNPVNAATSSSDTATIMAELEEEIAAGTFDSEALTDAEHTAIWETYDYDPEAIKELQRQSADTASVTSAPLATTYTHSDAFDGYDILNGIDVSKWQATIDWDAVKASGIDFVFIRVAYASLDSGTLNTDPTYKTNIEGALAAGLDVGVYIFSQATSTAEAKAEAKYAISLVKSYNINLPIVMDYEYGATGTYLRSASLTTTQRAKICNAFCSYVEGKGYTAMVYANYSMLTCDIATSKVDSSYPIWIARYNTATEYTASYDYWQYSDSGSVNGISGSVDMNFRYIKKPSKVTNLECTTATSSSITLSWKKVVGAYGYRIYRLNNETGSYEYICSTKGASTTTYTDSDLTLGVDYTYKVRAYYKLTESNYYGTYSAALTAAPNENFVSTDMTVSATTKATATLAWSEVTGASKYVLYQLDSSTGEYVKLGSTTKLKYKVSGLDCGTAYTFKISAYIDGSLHDDPTSVTATTLPGKVSGLAYTATKSKIKLTWNTQENMAGYKIYVKKSGSWKLVKTIKDGSTGKYTYSGLSSNTKYVFSVVGYYTSGKKTVTTGRSDALNTVTATSRVKNFAATVTSKTSVTLSWTATTASVDGYIIYKKDVTSKTGWTKVKTLKSTKKTSYIVTDLISTSSYKFKITAYRKYNGQIIESAASAVSVQITPDKVEGVTVKKYDTTFLLSWDADESADGYYVYQVNNSTGKTTDIATITDSSVNTCVVPHTPSTKYSYYVKSYNTYGKKTYYSKRSSAATLTTDAQRLTVTGRVVNIRKKANTSSTIKSTVKKGKTLNVIKAVSTDTGVWFYVSYTKSGVTYKGYISGDYVMRK